MSSPDSWQGKLKSSKGNIPSEKQTRTIHKFKREKIFNHNYNVNQLFEQFYKISPQDCQRARPKRQPNPFMILRAVVGLVANDIGIKEEIGDGIEQSKLAGFIWGGASKEDKDKFDNLCTEFKVLHKQLFPKYIYKPTPRNSKVGSVVDVKTPIFYQSPPSDSFKPTITYSSDIQEIDNIRTSDINPEVLIEGDGSYQTQIPYDQITQSQLYGEEILSQYIQQDIPLQQPSQYNNPIQYSTISANCPDPNYGQMSPCVTHDPISGSIYVTYHTKN